MPATFFPTVTRDIGYTEIVRVEKSKPMQDKHAVIFSYYRLVFYEIYSVIPISEWMAAGTS